MNNTKRKELKKAIDLLEEAKSRIETIMNEEQEGFDNLNEGLQQSMSGQAMEEAVGNMETAIDSIDDAISYIEEAQA